MVESGHIIVCGMGDIGFRVAELLHRLGERVAVVTLAVRDERRQSAEAAGVRVLLGDARNERLLLAAGLAGARALVAATDQDLVNIEIVLDAHRLRPDLPVVARLFDQDLARQLETTFDLRRALGMSALAAPNFAAAALGGSVLASFTVGGAPFVVDREEAGPGPLAACANVSDVARLHGLLTLARERPDGTSTALPGSGEAVEPGDHLALLARKEDWDRLFESPGTPGERASKPRPGRVPLRHRFGHAAERLQAFWRDEPLPLRALAVGLGVLLPLTVALFHFYLGLSLTEALFHTVNNLYGEISLSDTKPEIRLYEILLMVLGSLTVATLYSLITDALIASRLRKVLGGKPLPRGGHVVVVGIGHIGYRVAAELLGLGVPVVAVDTDAERSFVTAVRAQAPVVIGDARVEETLARAGLATARAVVAATGDDAVNLGIGLAAKRMNRRARTVVRLFDADLAQKVESALAIDAALGASRIAAPTFAASALYPDVIKAFQLGDRLLILLHRPAGTEWGELTPAELRERKGIQVLQRAGRLSAADDERPLDPGEEVLAALWRPVAPAWGTVPAAGSTEEAETG